MSSLRVRNILIGMFLVAALTLALPVSTEAAGLAPAARGGDGWMDMIWTWVSQLWNGETREAPAGSAAIRQVNGADSAGPTTTSGTNGTPCGGDQGVCIDPNG